MADQPTIDVPQPGRLSLSLGNLAGGNLTSSIRALGAPDTLGPEERRTLADRIFGSSPSAYKSIFEVVSDPFVAVGLILHLKFPVATAQNLFKFSKEVSGTTRTFLPGFRHLQSFGELFRGTKARDLYLDLLDTTRGFKEKHTLAFGEAIERWQRATGKTFGGRDQIRIFAHLDGLDKSGNELGKFLGNAELGFRRIQLDGADRTLVSDLRKGLGGIWDEVFGTDAGRANIKRVRDELRQQGVQIGEDDLPQFLKDFVPHIRTRSKADVLRDIQRTIEGSPGLETVQGKIATAQAGRVLSPSAFDRAFKMIPNIRDLEQVEDLLKPGTLQAVKRRREIFQGLVEEGEINAIPEYSLRLAPALSTYIHGMGRTFAWTVKDFGPQLQREVRTLKAAGTTGQIQAHMLENTYLPIALGKHSLPQAMQALQWGGLKASTLTNLQALKTQMGPNTLTGRAIGKVEGLLLDDRSVINTGDAGSRLAGYFYLSTLGGNPASAFANLFQTVLTTAPTIGAQATAKGMLTTLDKAQRYFQLRAGGTGSRAAFQKIFPDFVESGLAASPLSQSTLRSALDDAWDATRLLPVNKLGRAGDRAKQALMRMFTTSEQFVRMTAFEGSLWKATKDGMKDPEARRQFARRVVETTQFLSGPASTPLFATNLPPFARQFLQFGARVGEFTVGPGTTLGSGAQSLQGPILSHLPFLRGRNPGTLGRTLLASGLAGGIAREALGVDLDRFLLGGAFPGPREFGPFAPLPLVPPAFSVVGAFAQDLANQDFDQSRFALPLLVPGGVAASRAVGFLPGDTFRRIGEFLGRENADYSGIAPDGTVPVFSSRGSFKGRYTPTQIVMRAAGLPFEDQQAEQELMGILIRNGDRIRELRRQYIDASLHGEQDRAEQVQEAHRRAFGLDIYVRPQDWEAAKIRRDTPRLMRTLESLPRPNRDVMMQALQVGMMERMSALQDADPGIVQGTPIADVTDLLGGGGSGGQRPVQFGTGTGFTGPTNLPLRDLNPVSGHLR